MFLYFYEEFSINISLQIPRLWGSVPSWKIIAAEVFVSIAVTMGNAFLSKYTGLKRERTHWNSELPLILGGHSFNEVTVS